MFKWYLARVKKKIGKILKCLRFEKGGEFKSNDFEMFLMTEESKDKHLLLEPLHKMELLKGGTNL